MGIRELKRPLVRRIGRLVVRISAEGIELRGYRRRKSLSMKWAGIASLTWEDRDLLREAEEQAGRLRLKELGAEPTEEIGIRGAGSRNGNS
jgi:hypothetical protein